MCSGCNKGMSRWVSLSLWSDTWPTRIGRDAEFISCSISGLMMLIMVGGLLPPWYIDHSDVGYCVTHSCYKICIYVGRLICHYNYDLPFAKCPFCISPSALNENGYCTSSDLTNIVTVDFRINDKWEFILPRTAIPEPEYKTNFYHWSLCHRYFVGAILSYSPSNIYSGWLYLYHI